MYVRDLADSMLRRWYLFVVALAVTAGACFFASQAIGPTYRSQASVVLVPPKSAEDPSANRFLALSGLTQAVDVLSRAMNADKTHESVHQVVPEGTFEVTEDGSTSAPVLLIAAEASSVAQVDALVAEVLRQVPSQLSALQSDLSIPKGAEITSMPLVQDDDPTASQKARMRAIAALAVLCLGASALLIGALDGVLLLRSARKLGGRPTQGQPGSDLDDEPLPGGWLDGELVTASNRADPGKPTGGRGASSRDRP